MLRFKSLWMGLVAALCLVACANQMEPAKAALDKISGVITEVTPEASKFVPEQLAEVQGKFDKVKAAFESKDYASVLTSAPALLNDAQGLVSAVASKKEELVNMLNGKWSSLASSLPGLLQAVQGKADELSKLKKLPAGVDLTSAKSALADAGSLWTQASDAFKGGNLEQAVNTADEVKSKVQAAADALKFALPGAAPAAG